MAVADVTTINQHEAYLGIDVRKETYWAFAIDYLSTELSSRRISNIEPELDVPMAPRPEDALVIDQRRNIGALVLLHARAANKPVAYPP